MSTISHKFGDGWKRWKGYLKIIKYTGVLFELHLGHHLNEYAIWQEISGARGRVSLGHFEESL